MESAFREDILQQENSFFLKETSLLPKYAQNQLYYMHPKDIANAVLSIHENSQFELPTSLMKVNKAFFIEKVMKRCFSKCKAFVLEDWIDYDELDCTMKCTLLYRESADVMKDVYNKL